MMYKSEDKIFINILLRMGVITKWYVGNAITGVASHGIC